MKTVELCPAERTPILMIDARNCMYRAIYAGKRGNQHQHQRHYFIIMLRMISSWIKKYKPGMVQVFWDAPRSTVWRRKIMTEYKDRDYNSYIASISEELVTTERVARLAFQYLNVYQFRRNHMEADDLIYAACRLQCNRPMVICSTDSDMQQIPFVMPCVKLYDPEKHAEVPTAQHNPVLVKALSGDEADRILGYQGIGPKTSIKLIKSPKLLEEHLQRAGRGVFLRNLLLIDMGLCPYVMHNQLYISKSLAKQPVFDRAELLNLEREHQLFGLSPEYGDIVVPFKTLPNE